MNKISQTLDQLNDITALVLLAVTAVELAFIGNQLSVLVSKL